MNFDCLLRQGKYSTGSGSSCPSCPIGRFEASASSSICDSCSPGVIANHPSVVIVHTRSQNFMMGVLSFVLALKLARCHFMTWCGRLKLQRLRTEQNYPCPLLLRFLLRHDRSYSSERCLRSGQVLEQWRQFVLAVCHRHI